MSRLASLGFDYGYTVDGLGVHIPPKRLRPESLKANKDELIPIRGWAFFVAVKRDGQFIGHTIAPFMDHPQWWLNKLEYED